jgi:hypothetical protein
MNTYSIHFNFSSTGFDVNLFNQFDVYFSYAFATVLVLTVIGLRVRKVMRKRKQLKAINDIAGMHAVIKTDDPFADDWSL